MVLCSAYERISDKVLERIRQVWNGPLASGLEKQRTDIPFPDALRLREHRKAVRHSSFLALRTRGGHDRVDSIVGVRRRSGRRYSVSLRIDTYWKAESLLDVTWKVVLCLFGDSIIVSEEGQQL